jgi:GNAT superfamily N-acetyltransferase
MEVRAIAVTETYSLRSRVLRPGQPLEACRYAQDSVAVHFGVFEQGALCSVITAHPENSPLFGASSQWRIRGMATEPERQGQGFGSAGLSALLDWGRAQGIPLFWCNARVGALPFYARAGFSVESPLFDIPGIGPHRVMKIEL